MGSIPKFENQADIASAPAPCRRYRDRNCFSLPIIPLLALLLVALTGLPVPAQTIGISLPLGGDYARLSGYFLDGAKLALEQSGRAQDIKLAVVDDGCDEEIGQLAIDDLKAQSPAIITGFFCNAPARLAAQAFKPLGTPILVAGARSPRLLKDKSKEEWNLWRIAGDDGAAPQAAAAAISSLWRDRAFALVDDGTIYGRTYVDRMRVVLDDLGTPAQFLDTFRAAQSSQAGLLRRLQRSGVNAAFVASASADDLLVIAKNLKSLEIPIELATSEALAILPFVEEPAQYKAGTLVLMERAAITLKTAQSVVDLLEENELEPDGRTFEGYAAIEVALAALGDTPESTSRNLNERTFDTILGPVRFDENGQNRNNRYVINQWDGEQFVPLEVDTSPPQQTQ